MKRTVLLLSFGIVMSLGPAAIYAGITTQTYFFPQPTVEIVNGQTVVIMEGTHTWGDVGEPLLPHAPVQLLLPPGEEAISISVEFADALILGDGYRISPRQQPVPISFGPPSNPTPPNEVIYSVDDPFPKNRAGNLHTQFLCGHGIAYAVLYPVSYQPVSGTIAYYPWIKITIESAPSLKALQSHDLMLKRTHSVQERIAKIVQNPESISIYGPQTPTDPEGWDMLLITAEDFIDDYQEYIDYKNRSGILTTVVTVEDIYTSYPGNDVQEMIRNCIIEYYTDYDISYVFLCGDNDYIASRGLWCQSDNIPADVYYAGLDGNWNNDGDDRFGEPGEADLLAEVFVGRSCADNEWEIQHVVNKNLLYQTQPVVDEIETALMVGENLDWAIWAWEYKEEVRLGSSSWGYSTAGIPATISVDTLYERPGYSWSAYYDLLPRLNLGPNLVNHLGHANEYYVMKFGLSMINDYNFTNDGVNHNFFIGYSQGCYPGAFENNYPDCILEEFTTIAHGAVAFVGNSRYGWGDYYTTNGPSQYFDRQFFDAIYGEDVTVIAKTNQDSKEDNIWAIQGDNLIRWCYYELNLFGDPTLDIWTAEPGIFTPIHSPVALLGSQSFPVSGISVPGALVTASLNNEVLGRAEANATGVAVVNFDQVLNQPGQLDLMITAHNMIPYSASIEIISSPGPWLIYSSCIIEDEQTGNGNGQLDYSESADLTMEVANVGNSSASNVNLLIHCDDPLMTIHDSTEVVENIGANSTATAENAFTLEIGPDVEDGHSFSFTLTATDGDSVWISPFNIIGHAPEVAYSELFIDDAAGNNDNHLDPGETADFLITIINDGSADAPNLLAVLSSSEPLITIPQNSVTLSILEAGSETTLTYTEIFAGADITQGDSVEFTLAVTAEGGYTCSLGFSILVGDTRHAPIGPDAYGYYAYDMYDGPQAPVYNWIEIAPLAGGSGTDLQLSDYDAEAVGLPFTFRYYGIDYDSVNVGDDGWLSFGSFPIFPPINFQIPNVTPPNSMVAAFWDEFSPSVHGQVCTYYDEENHRFIIEWYQVPHTSNLSAQETFQFVLPNPDYCPPTTTGDGEIIVNYHTVSSLVNGCTIGCENLTGTVGLSYLYNGSYNEHSMPLETSFAIKYTTGCETSSDLEINMMPLTMPMVIPANGGDFDFLISLENQEATPLTFDIWIMTELPGGTWFGPVLGPVNLTLAENSTISRIRTQSVPGSAPAGIYTYEGRVGTYPDEIWDSDNFTFEKLTVGDGIGFMQEWSNTGESFSEWFTVAQIEIPSEFSLHPAYPNPFNPSTTIRFSLPQNSFVNLTVFDLQGRSVQVLVDATREAGYHEITFDASDLASGLYFYRLQAGKFTSVQKMVLMK